MHKKALLGRPDAFDVAKIPYGRFGRCTIKRNWTVRRTKWPVGQRNKI